MPDLAQTRQRLKIGVAALVVIDIAAAALLFSPLIGSQRSRAEKLDELWRELQIRTREVEPLRGLDRKIPEARRQIDDFYRDRLTSQDSVVSGELGKLASQNGVKITGIKYDQGESNRNREVQERDPATVGLNRLVVDADLTGGYLQIMRFVNSLERSRLFFLVDSVQLGSEQGGVVKLRMKLETYLRTGGSE